MGTVYKMLFNFINKYTFISNCNNYKITITKAGNTKLFSCFRSLNQGNTWENINENPKSYLTYQAASLRINQVHKSEPEKALIIAPDLAGIASPIVASDHLDKIRGYLK